MAATQGDIVHNKINAFNIDSSEKITPEAMTLQDSPSKSNTKNEETNNNSPIDYTATPNPNAVEKSKQRLEEKFFTMKDNDESKTFLSESGDHEKMYVDSVSPILGNDPLCCGVQCTSQMRTLTLTMTLFATITLAQFVAALCANSLALLGDCASMLVDTLTYAGNIAAETCQTDQRRRIRNQLIASGFSLSVLILITMFITIRAITRLIDFDENDEDVNAYIIFGFAIGGLCFDLSSFLAFYFWNKDIVSLNMKSALLHVFSDTLRSLTTLVESIVIWKYEQAGGKIDAWASIIVSGLIFFGAFGAILEWVAQFMKFRKQIPLYDALLEESFYVPGEGRDNILLDEV